MKKICMLLIALLSSTLFFTGCLDNSANEKSTIKDTKALFDTVLEKKLDFPVIGGNSDPIVEGKAGKLDLKENVPGLTDRTKEEVKEGSIFSHGMNANLFTGIAIRVDSKKAVSIRDAIIKDIKNEKWLCGAPNYYTFMIVENEYVVYSFGDKELVQTFVKIMHASFDHIDHEKHIEE